LEKSRPRGGSQNLGERLNMSSTLLAAAHQRFTEYISAFKSAYYRMDYEIDLLAVAVLTKQHLFIKGPAGVAKSHLARKFLGGIRKSNLFALQFGEGVTFEDIFGPVNHKIWREEARIVHETEGSMVEAHFALLDEFMDAPPRVGRMLLSALNEREVVYGRWHQRIPLWTAVATTNFSSRDEKMVAVLDRFTIRHNMDRQYGAEDFGQISISSAAKSFTPPPLYFSDIQLLHRRVAYAAERIGVPESLAKLAVSMSRKQFYVSPRRFVALQRALGAYDYISDFPNLIPSLMYESGNTEVATLHGAVAKEIEAELLARCAAHRVIEGVKKISKTKRLAVLALMKGAGLKVPQLSSLAAETVTEIVEMMGIPYTGGQDCDEALTKYLEKATGASVKPAKSTSDPDADGWAMFSEDAISDLFNRMGGQS